MKQKTNRKLLERKTVKYYKKRKNGRKEKERRTFSFEKNWFCLEENKHTVLLCQ